MFDDFPEVEALLLEPHGHHAVPVMWDHVQPTAQGLQVWLKPRRGQKVILLPSHWSHDPPECFELHFEHGLLLRFSPEFYQGPLPLEVVASYLVFMLIGFEVRQETLQNQATTKISSAQLLALHQQRAKERR